MAKKHPTKRRKLELVFDEKKRREYLTGFRKRKEERRQKAKTELEQQVKEERKRIREEMKEGLKKQFKKSYAPIPELEEESLNEEEYETEDVSVKIVELSTSDLAETHNWIGQNRPHYENATAEINTENADEKNDVDEIPGMGLKPKPIQSKKSKKAATNDADDNIQSNKEYKSKRDFLRTIQKTQLKTMKHSKILQTKQKVDQLKDRKKARMERDKRIKQQKKDAKKHSGRISKKINKRMRNKK